MRKLLLIVIVAFFASTVIAQQPDTVKYWKVGGDISLTFSQISLTNWAAGGKSSYSGIALFNFTAKYAKNKSIWDTYFATAYGIQKTGDNHADKTEDKIDLSSTYGYQLSKNKKWYASLTMSFITQYYKGHDPKYDTLLISDFLAPGYLIVGAGFTFKPVDYFQVTYSPISYRLTVVNNQELANKGVYGLDPAERDIHGNVIKNANKTRHEIGQSFKLIFQKEIVKNVNFSTHLELFSNFIDNPQNIDVRWDVLIDMKINNFLTATLTTNLIYDDDIDVRDKDGNVGPRTQFKETLGIGLIYRFGSVFE